MTSPVKLNTSYEASKFNLTTAQDEWYSKIAIGIYGALAIKTITSYFFDKNSYLPTICAAALLTRSFAQATSIKDYYNSENHAKMRTEALASGFFQVLSSHGSISKILDEKILTPKELKNKKDQLPTNIKILATVEIARWEKENGVYNLFSRSKFKDYHNPVEFDKMRKEAILSNFFQVINSHGSVSKILEAKILTVKELETKLDQALGLKLNNPLFKAITITKIIFFRFRNMNFNIDKATVQMLTSSEGRTMINATTEIFKWKASHLVSSLASFLGKDL